MRHYCHICERSLANEKFSGRGHRDHICKDCQKMPGAERDRKERLDEVLGFLDQRHISEKNIGRLRLMASHADKEVQALAALVLEIALEFPHRKRRWKNMPKRNFGLFKRAKIALDGEWYDHTDVDDPEYDEPCCAEFCSQSNDPQQLELPFNPPPPAPDYSDDIPF